MPNLEWIELAARLGGAVLAGAILGVNRDLHRKPAGLRTHALVCLGSAVVVVIVASMTDAGADAVSRVIQGVVTGVGFIGAGVILHHDTEHRVEGKTWLEHGCIVFTQMIPARRFFTMRRHLKISRDHTAAARP